MGIIFLLKLTIFAALLLLLL